MLISVQDWTFHVDFEQTKAYCDKNAADHCQCGYCRNFYAAIDERHPELRMFLKKFGAYVEAPNELMPFEPTLYEATYCISGTILKFGKEPIQLEKLLLYPVTQDELDFETECPSPCFAFNTSYIELPWVLDEDMNEVISPANEPEYLRKMWNKLLSRVPEDPAYS